MGGAKPSLPLTPRVPCWKSTPKCEVGSPALALPEGLKRMDARATPEPRLCFKPALMQVTLLFPVLSDSTCSFLLTPDSTCISITSLQLDPFQAFSLECMGSFVAEWVQVVIFKTLDLWGKDT